MSCIKNQIIILLCSIIIQPCFGQDIRGFIMQQYENWFSSEDSIIGVDKEPPFFKRKDVILSSKKDFFNSIQSFNVWLGYPQVAIAQINFKNKSLFFDIYFELLSDCEDGSCNCGGPIKECYKHLDDSVGVHKWKYYISDICDSDGYSLRELTYGFDEKDYIWYPASIRDKDGYVNVREGRSKESNIVGQIKTDEVIFYTPSVVSDWWRVYYYSNVGPKFGGYVHKSRIIPYSNSTPAMKIKIEKIMR